MQTNRMVCMILVCSLIIGAVAVPVSAAETSPVSAETGSLSSLDARATNSFSMTIPAKATALSNISFSMMAGETITFKASYGPFSADLDVGFLAPDGEFYFFSVTGGSIDRTIKLSQSGKYTVQIRNKSDTEVYVTGLVGY